MMSVRVRFAPSPTGYLHIGGARTALFNYLFARQHQGQFILRIDDTDAERNRPEYEQAILESFKWLGLDYDEFYRQSERKALYQEQLEKLIAQGRAYVSKEEVRQAGERGEVIRLKNPGQKIKFKDLIRGEVEFDTTDLGDFVIAKDLATPVYHFASVVDDADLKITHVIRAEEHLSNTPRQILILEALGAARPHYAHIPLILAPDRSKLSKRHGATSVTEYQQQGYLRDALINFLGTLGWSPQAAGLEQELLSLEELIRYFQLEQVQKSGAIFNLEKLDWFNHEYLKRLGDDELLGQLEPYFCPPGHSLASEPARTAILRRLLPEIRSRITKFSDIKADDWSYFFTAPAPTRELLRDGQYLPAVIEKIAALPAAPFDVPAIKEALWDYATMIGRGKVLWPLRVALSGRERSADPFTVAAVLGQEETLRRLRHALTL